MLRLMGLLATIACLSVGSAAAQARRDQSDLDWKCNATPSFSAVCHLIRAGVEGRLPQAGAEAAFRGYEVVVQAEASGSKIIFDFKNQSVHGQTVADLLSITDRLLPLFVTGIKLSNITLVDEFELKQTSFSRALTLKSVCLGTEDCAALAGRQGFWDKCESDANLSFDGSTFDGPVILENVSGCGGFDLYASVFKRGLLIEGDPGRRGDHDSMSKGLFVNNSQISPELYLNQISYNSVDIALSNIKTVLIHGSTIRDKFGMRDSEVFSLASFGSGFSEVDIKGNKIRDSLTLSNLDTDNIYLGGNRIGGRLALGVNRPEVEAGTGVSRLVARLHGNQVVSAADIFVGEQVPADIGLRGSRFQSELFLSRARMVDGGWLEAVAPDQADPADDTAVHVNFTGASVGTLVWNLPTEDQNYGWEGNSFRYTHWDPRQRSGLRPYEIEHREAGVQEIKDWVKRLDPAAEATSTVDPLTYAADYLKSHGHVAEQATVRIKALRQDFGNRVSSQWSPWALLFSALVMVGVLISVPPIRRVLRIPQSFVARIRQWVASLDSPIKVAGTVVGALVFLALLWQVAAFVGNLVFFIALSPVGWGAKPELAILLMAVMSLGCWLLYIWHSRRWQDEWDRYLRAENGLRITIPSHQLEFIRDFVRSSVREIREEPGLYRHATAEPDISAPLPDRMSLSVSVGTTRGERTPREQALREEEEPAYSRVPGFCQYDSTYPPRRFHLFLYSLDATLPVINLYHFNRYYPFHKPDERPLVRWLSIGQHGVGWWLSTIFVASLVI